VSAVVIDADDDLRSLEPERRNCLFQDETMNLRLFKSYSQESIS
jgi:hypothetical protein